MSNNKFDALGSDDSEGDDTLNNHQQLEVRENFFDILFKCSTIWTIIF